MSFSDILFYLWPLIFFCSIFYVYYEQYLTIVKDACLSLGISLLAVFLVTFLLTGLDMHSSLIVLAVVTSLLINMTGLLYWANITLNAISLINLVVVSTFSFYCNGPFHWFALVTKLPHKKLLYGSLIIPLYCAEPQFALVCVEIYQKTWRHKMLCVFKR